MNIGLFQIGKDLEKTRTTQQQHPLSHTNTFTGTNENILTITDTTGNAWHSNDQSQRNDIFLPSQTSIRPNHAKGQNHRQSDGISDSISVCQSVRPSVRWTVCL